MEETKSTFENSDKQANGDVTKKYVSVPVRELSYMIEFVNNIYENLGHTSYNKAEAIAAVNGLKVATIKQILSTAQQYNLLELKHGTGYKVTTNFLKIKKPLNENEYRMGVFESLSNPQVFKDLFNDYSGHVIKRDGIKNKIQRDYGLDETGAGKLADIVLGNVNEYKLLNTHNILLIDKFISQGEQTPEAKPDAPEQPQINDKPKPLANDTPLLNNDELNMIKLPVPMGNGSFAYVTFPRDYDEDDLDMISTIVLAYKKRKKKAAQPLDGASGN